MITEIKGWHVLAAFVLSFGIIIAVNLTLDRFEGQTRCLPCSIGFGLWAKCLAIGHARSVPRMASR